MKDIIWSRVITFGQVIHIWSLIMIISGPVNHILSRTHEDKVAEWLIVKIFEVSFNLNVGSERFNYNV